MRESKRLSVQERFFIPSPKKNTEEDIVEEPSSEKSGHRNSAEERRLRASSMRRTSAFAPDENVPPLSLFSPDKSAELSVSSSSGVALFPVRRASSVGRSVSVPGSPAQDVERNIAQEALKAKDAEVNLLSEENR